MKFTYNWLKQYVEFDWSPQQLAEKLTFAGIEVEELINLGGMIPPEVIITEILSSDEHPNADKLSVCRVTGDRIYSRTQIAWPTIVPLVIVAGIFVPVFVRAELVAGPWILAAVYGVGLLLFATLTVTVTNDGLVASFGIGLIRKEVPFGEVVSFARVQTRWIDGWGIHTYPGGMLYNASGLSAVEFKLSSGRSVRRTARQETTPTCCWNTLSNRRSNNGMSLHVQMTYPSRGWLMIR